MKSNFIDKLGITNLDSSVISLYSTFGIGKTTLLAVVASEFYHDGKNVLFLSQDEDEKTIIKKVRKALVGTKPNLNFVTLTAKTYVNLTEDIKTQLNAKKYDVIIVDGVIADFDFLRNLSFDTKVIIMTTQRQVTDILRYDKEDVLQFVSNKVTQKSDMVLTLKVKKEFGFWYQLKYFFCFWLKKPNRTLKILKNRYGKEGIVDIHINFKDVKIN